MAPEPEPPVGCPSYYRPSWAVPNGCPPVVTRTVPAVPVSVVVAAAWLCVVLSDLPCASYPLHRLPLLAVGVDTRAVAGAGTVAVASAVVGVEDPPEQARSPQRLHDSIAAAAAAAKVGQEPHRSHLVECEVMTVVPDFLDIPVALAVVAAAAGCIAAVVVGVVVLANAVMAPAFSDIPAVARPVAAVAVVVAAAVVAAAVVSSIVSNSRILALNHSQRLQRQ